MTLLSRCIQSCAITSLCHCICVITQETLDHRHLTSVCRCMKSIVMISSELVDICFLAQQQLNHRFVTTKRCCLQSITVMTPLGVGTCPILEQHLNHCRVTIECRIMQSTTTLCLVHFLSSRPTRNWTTGLWPRDAAA